MSGGWIDRHGDVWTEGDDGLMHTPETAPFSREHVERKWGPLTPEPSEVAEPTAGERVDALARILMAAWEAAEGKPVHVSYVATHADMARAVLASPWLAAHVSAAETKARADERERIAEALERGKQTWAEYPVAQMALRDAQHIAQGDAQ